MPDDTQIPPRLAVGASPATALSVAVSLVLGWMIAAGTPGRAGDILRGGAGSSKSRGAPSATSEAPGVEQARANAKDALARTTEALQSVRAMQETARNLALKGPNNLGRDPGNPGQRLPAVPNGLKPGGLEVAPGVPRNLAAPQLGEDSKLWQGAKLPKEFRVGTDTVVSVEQTSRQAILNWRTFNIGKSTRLQINQARGGAQKGEWISFNKVNDPSGSPSQILGKIEAPGHVYVINRNGIIFGGSSQIQVRTLVGSSLPINDNLIQLGLLNNRDSQFLFSGLAVPGGADGTPAFNPEPPPTGTGRYGDVVVQAGAQLTSPISGDGNGGRIMLVGPNVENAGAISTPAGQTILAAGLQVAAVAHASGDPSLRGLDIFVGAVGDYAGTVTNSGLIEAPTGSALLTGKLLIHRGAIESTTSVDLNGRIDLLASYGAVSNPSYDNGLGGPQFIYQNTGNVSLAPESVTRILPDYASESAVPGTALPQNSQINLEGLSIHAGPGAMIFAPSADVSMRAGVWPYKDANGDRTVFDAEGKLEPKLGSYFGGATQTFFFSGGQIYLDSLSLLNVAGSIDVAVPLAHSILEVEFRGTEFADSPAQRDGPLRAIPLTVDIRRTGSYDGRFWMGTPLGDATGLAGIIERNAAQLTAKGGSVTLRSGGSIVVQQGAVVDVSGGFFQHEGGMVKTTRLMQGGRLVDIANATPDQKYDGVFTGEFTQAFSRWGVTETFTIPWMMGERFEPGYAEGAAGGTLNLKAPSMAIDGELRGITVQDPRGRALPPDYSTLAISFNAERSLETTSALNFLPFSPTPPTVNFSNTPSARPAAPFRLVDGQPVALGEDRVTRVTLSPELLEKQGFGHLTIENTDGNITLPTLTKLNAPAGGSITFAAANVNLRSNVSAPGGELKFVAHNISPSFTAAFPLVNPGGAAAPAPNPGRGLFSLSAGAELSTAGLVVDDRATSANLLGERLATAGGKITIEAYDARLAPGTTIDVSGGASVSARGTVTYGKGGSLTILTGKDPGFSTVIGGKLELGSTLAGYSGSTGGSLSLRASLIQIGGAPKFPNTLLLQPDFFRHGGFTSYTLEGIGALIDTAVAVGEPAIYAPAISIAPGTVIQPVAESWLATSSATEGGRMVLCPRLADVGQRSPVSLSFNAPGSDDLFTLNKLESRGDIVLGAGAQIATDSGGSISFNGQTVSIEGSLFAPGGTISIAGAGRFPFPQDQQAAVTIGRPTVYISPQSVLSAAGTATYLPDAFGRRIGMLYPGGSILISGNIVAEGGAVLDVSGASAVFDLHPSVLMDGGQVVVPVNSGVTDSLWRLASVPTVVESSGGLIDLQGAQMLFTDATLLGRAGGPSAIGGTLSIFSGRFYGDAAARTSADINLVVTQSGRTIAATNRDAGVGVPVLNAVGAPIQAMGYFAADRFLHGGFESLDLGFKFIDGNPLSFGGNVEFRSPVSIVAPGKLRVAAGGIIQANAPVNLTSDYFAVGQPFRPPLHPDDPDSPFTQSPALPDSEFFPTPTFGPGRLTVHAELIDIGNLTLMNIGRASFLADGGDIRGNGTLSIAGDLFLRAGQVYPTTLGTFNIFAYDHAGLAGSVNIAGWGRPDAPLSAGGALNIFASRIVNGGLLRAPMGSITLGWDGTDFDLSDADLDAPRNPAVGASLPVPVAKQVILKPGSTTSVAAITGTPGHEVEMIIPFGISPDGESWIDPRGVNVTVNGLPQKQISIAGDHVNIMKGSTIDLRGGGDLVALRWVQGTRGSTDLLGNASTAWSGAATYEAGDLVSFGGQTWSARARHSGVQPSISLLWSLVNESYAVVPGYQAAFAPYAPFNTGGNATLLGGDPGYVSSTLKVGDQIYLNATPGLPAGNYTLLPRRYAALPGAFLVTPSKSAPLGTIELLEGANYVAGYTFNGFADPLQPTALRTQYEVASYDTVQGRVQYDQYYGNDFFEEAARKFDIERVQRLPIDSGYLAIQGNLSLRAEGMVETAHPRRGRGAEIDLSSFADMYLIGKGGAAPAGATVVLDTALLSSWGAESLVIGGLRRRGAENTTIEVRTNQLVLDNPLGLLHAPDIALVSKEKLTVTDGSAFAATGILSESAQTYVISGDGVLLRASRDPYAEIIRTNVTGSTAPLLTIGNGAALSAPGLILDSSYGTDLDPGAILIARGLTLGSGQISLVLAPPGSLTGSVVSPHLVIAGDLLDEVQKVDALTLRSYRTIDIYGAGDFGGSIGLLRFLGAGIRGFDQGGASATIGAGSVLFSNPSNVAALPAPAVISGSLAVNAGTVQLGANAFTVLGYDNVSLNATKGLISVATGSFSTPGNLTIDTPLITSARDWKYSVNADGALVLADSSAGRAKGSGGLGASFAFSGASLVADTTIRLPSGEIRLLARTGALSVGGTLDVAGLSRDFYGQTHYTDGGLITLTAAQGDVTLAAGSTLSVAAPGGGGDAGAIRISAPQGSFTLNGATLLGSAAPGETSGSFSIDIETLPSFTELAGALNDGGFFERRDLRLRLGDLVIANPTGGTNVAHTFNVSADAGSIHVTGTIDASGVTGGEIALVANGDLVLEPTAVLTTRAKLFRNSGAGGDIRLDAGAAVNGVANLAARVDLQAGSNIDLGVDEYVAGSYTTPGSSAFNGQFTGKLHLRAPRSAGNDAVGVNELKGTITGASSIVVEGYEIQQLTGNGLITGWRSTFTTAPAAGTLQRAVYDSATSFLSAGNHASMMSTLLGADPQGLTPLVVIAPGVEIVNLNGDLTLGSANSTSLGSAALNSADWNLADFRFGPQNAPGVLTLRASGNVVFLNALSDGFRPDPTGTPGGVFLPNGTTAGQSLWLSPVARINDALPLNAQSWSYRITAGADVGAADFHSVVPMDTLAATSGSLQLGKFYAAPLGVSGSAATTAAVLTNRFQTIRTGTGNIDITAARDIELRNQFATIYTAGVRLPDPNSIFAPGDFATPIVIRSNATHPSQGNLGAVQQNYSPQWSLAGGNVSLSAQRNIERITLLDGQEVADSSRQIPTNWLYRRGYVDPATGLFGIGGVDSDSPVIDPAASTTWWVDFSNFFQGIGALGGGDISMFAGANVSNVDAVIPTNARMPGRTGVGGTNLAPDATRLVELGGGDLTLRADLNLDGGIYYLERGDATLTAGDSIHTNKTRSPSLGILSSPAAPEILDEKTWLPTTLFAGRTHFDISARGDVLLGPTVNTFLLPQGLNNKFWYKTYFNTFSPDAAVSVESFGGGITHRLAVTLPGAPAVLPILDSWLSTQNLFTGPGSTSASNFQPWIRLAETDTTFFGNVLTVAPSTLRSTAFSGDVNVVGDLTLFPSPIGTLELTASGSIIGLNPTGIANVSGRNVSVWTAASVNVSDADPDQIPGVTTPLAYQSLVGRAVIDSRQSNLNPFLAVNRSLLETGSFSGEAASFVIKQSLHSQDLLHAGDHEPIRLSATGGDITGLTLYAPKKAEVFASKDISDVSLYIQHVDTGDVSIVSAGRDVVPFSENSAVRSSANDFGWGNFVGDPEIATTSGASTNALAGDIQISGPGVLEVLAGRNIDLGSGANLADGTGLGITSIGNFRNPFLPFAGADLIVLAGVGGSERNAPSLGLAESSLDVTSFIEDFVEGAGKINSAYIEKLKGKPQFEELTPEQQAIVSLEIFFRQLRDTGRDFADSGSYDLGFKAIDSLFGSNSGSGEVFTRVRDIRTGTGGTISIGAPTGGLTMASDIFGNPLTPPGIVTEYGGAVSIFTDQSVDIGRARIFTLRGGDLLIWSSAGDIAAGTAPKTVVTAPPTRVVIDAYSADVKTDLGGLATGGGIGVLASVKNVTPGDVDLVAPTGTVDAGDAGIRATGNLSIAAVSVLNASNISVGGSSTGVPTVAPVAAPNLAGAVAGNSAAAAGSSAANEISRQSIPREEKEEEPSLITVELLEYDSGAE